MATFYFNGAGDGDWQTLGNWWMSYDAETDTHSVPATSLPTSTDSIEVRGSISSNSGSEPTVVNALFLTYNFISITVTGNCVFSGISYNLGVITGDCTFNDSSGNMMLGTINGDCTFNDNAFAGAIITGSCIFNDSSFVHLGTITGDCTFNGDARNQSGTITGDCTFNHNSRNESYVVGYATFNDYSYNRIEWLPDYSAMVKSGAVFKSAVFNDYSANEGQVSWGATFNHNSRNGSAIFWAGVGGGSVNPPGEPPPRPAEEVATFNDSSYFLQGSVYIGSLFNHSSYFTTEYGGSLYVTPVFQNRTPYPIPRGINGSSILGVV